MIERIQRAPANPVLGGYMGPLNSKRPDTYCREELLEHATVLCMEVHDKPRNVAGPNKCGTCGAIMDGLSFSDPSPHPTRWGRTQWWKP